MDYLWISNGLIVDELWIRGGLVVEKWLVICGLIVNSSRIRDQWAISCKQLADEQQMFGRFVVD